MCVVEAIGARLPPTIAGAPAVPPRYLIEGMAGRIGIRISPTGEAHQREGHELSTTAAVIAEETAMLDLMAARNDRAALPEKAIGLLGAILAWHGHERQSAAGPRRQSRCSGQLASLLKHNSCDDRSYPGGGRHLRSA